MGLRLPKPVAPVRGELRVFPHGSMWRTTKQLRAEVVAQDSDMVPPLQYAWIAKVTQQGIVIMGTEYLARRPTSKPRVHSYAQTWWCKIETAQSVIERLTTVSIEPNGRA